MARRVSVSGMAKSDEDQVVELDFSKVLADAKQLTEWDEWVKEEEMAENQHLIEILTKINDLADWNLWKNDIKKIFQSFWKKFENKLKSNLTIEQAIIFRDEIVYLINNTKFDDKEIEQQINNLYTVLCTFVDPITSNENNEEIVIDVDKNPNIAISTNDNTKTENDARKEQEIKEAERKEQEIKESERKEQEIKEQERKEQERKEAEKREAERKEQERKEQERKEQERKEVEKREQERKAAEKKDLKKNAKVTDKTDNITEENEMDTSEYWNSLGNYILNKNFPWKTIMQDIINEKDENKKTDKFKLLKLQLVPYYQWHIDWIINQEALIAIEKYIDNNLDVQWDSIIKSSNVVRCGADWKIIDKPDLLNTAIKIIGNKELWHAYFLDYQDFEYTIETNTGGFLVTATIDDYNYIYDAQTNKLKKQMGDDPLQDVTNENILQEHFRTIAIATNK